MILHDDELCTLHLGDCVEVMRELSADSIDAIVTDPPYNLGFMGKAWDSKHQHEPWAREAFRVAKPGAHLLAFGGTRTYHRLASAIEDAGWEIRDCLVWAYASGFPKSLDVSKAIDKAAGAEREVTGSREVWGLGAERFGDKDTPVNGDTAIPVTAPATPDAAKWDGWGTALKPAWEPIVMARKPLRGTVAANVIAYSTGALNIGATRIGTTDELSLHGRAATDNGWDPRMSGAQEPGPGNGQQLGRWPANLLLTDPIFDGDTPGVVGGGSAPSRGEYTESLEQPPTPNSGLMMTLGDSNRRNEYAGDSGTYSRFFLVPKSSRSDREPVLLDYALRLHRESGACDKLPAWRRPALSPSGQTDSTSPARAISGGQSRDDSGSATSSPGKAQTARSPRATRSTTSTVTSRTTDSPISSSSIPSPTSASIPAASSATDNGGSPAPSAESSSLWGPLTGTSPERDGRSTDDADPATSPSWSGRSRCGDCGKLLPRVSTHPTQKPTALMRHLVRLVTPPGGTVLDCFLGSGTTAIAANAEGFRCIGIEKEQEYLDIALARMAHQPLGLGLDVEAPTRKRKLSEGVWTTERGYDKGADWYMWREDGQKA